MQTTKTKSSNCLQNIKNVLNEVDTLSTSEINKLQRIKTTIIAHLNKREEELLLEIKQSRDQDTAALETLHAAAKAIKADLRQFRDNIKTHEDNCSRLFIAAKRVKVQLDQFNTSLNDIDRKTRIRKYTLLRHTLVKKLLQNTPGIAHIMFTEG